jgi:hypothetical protein
VAHTCNPSYSGGRDQEDCGSKPAWANSLWDLILKKPFTEKGWWNGSRCRPWGQAPVPQKKKKVVFNYFPIRTLEVWPKQSKIGSLGWFQVRMISLSFVSLSPQPMTKALATVSSPRVSFFPYLSLQAVSQALHVSSQERSIWSLLPHESQISLPTLGLWVQQIYIIFSYHFGFLDHRGNSLHFNPCYFVLLFLFMFY